MQRSMDTEIRWPSAVRNSRIGLWVAGAAIVLVVTATGLVLRGGRSEASERDWLPVRRGTMSPIAIGTGEFLSSRQRLLSAMEPGTVIEVVHRTGDRVVAGTVLLRLRNPVLDHELEDAERSGRQAEEEFAAVSATTRLDRIEAETEVAQAEQADIAKRAELEANRALLEKGWVSRLQFERIEAESRLAHAQLDAKRATLAARQDLAQVQVEQARSRMEQQRENIRRARDRHAQLAVTAETDGVVKQVHAELGNAVQVGAPLALIGPEQPDLASLQFPQGHLDQMQEGLAISLQYNGREAGARIVSVNPDLSNGYVAVDVEPTESWPGAGIGMAVRAQAQFARVENALYVSMPAGLAGREGTLAALRERNGKSSPVDLQLRGEVDGYLLISGDVQPGDRLAFPPPGVAP